MLGRVARPFTSAWALLAAYSGLVAAVLIVALTALYVPDPGGSAPRVVISVDNSLWNRLGLNRWTYIRILRQEGLSPAVVRFDAVDEYGEAARLMRESAGLVLTGGGDVAPGRYGGEPAASLAVKPGRDELELALLAEAERAGLPVLGLCRGAQVLNVYLGGTLGAFRDQPGRYRRHMHHVAGHAVELVPDSRLASIYEGRLQLDVTTLHGQFVARPGRDVRIAAYAPDGTPEAIEVGSGSAFGMLGVQWHAEVPPWDARQRPLFEAFRDAAFAAADSGGDPP